MITHTLRIPCEVFTVRLGLAPAGGPSPLERLVLRAIAAGCDDFNQLADLFAIGKRPMLDLILDLWRLGYVLVDFPDTTVRLGAELEAIGTASERGRDAILDALRTPRLEYRDEELMFDLVSGHVMPLLPQPGRDTRQEIPPVLPIGTYREASGPALLRALARRNFSSPSGKPLVVQSANLKLEDAPAVGSREFNIQSEVWIDRDTGRLMFEVVQPIQLGNQALRALSQALAQLAEERPDAAFAKNLRARCREDDRGLRYDAPAEARALQAHVQSLAEPDPGVLARTDEALRDRVASLYESLGATSKGGDWSAPQAPAVSFHPGSDGAQQTLRRLIDAAEDQLVLVNPWVSRDGLARIEPSLTSALQRGVQVFLMWGIGPEESLDEQALNTVQRIQRGGPRPIVIASSPCLTHAKFAVADDRQALLSTANFLTSGEALAELTVMLDAERGDSAPIHALLDWARRHHPDFHQGRMMATTPSDFRSGTAGATVPLPDLPPPPPANPGVAEERQFWLNSWKRFVHPLPDQVDRTPPHPAPVRGQEHRQLLWQALREAQSILLVCSDQMTDRVIDQRLVDAIQAATARGVRVVLVFRRAEPGLVRGLRERLRDHPGFQLIQAENHAKVLISDDRVIVTSLNLLSVDGQKTGPNAHLQTSELGLELRGRAHVAAALAALASQVRGLPALDAGATERPPEVRPWERRLRAALEELGSASGELERRRVIHQLLTRGEAAMQILRELERLLPEGPELRTARATVLRRPSLTADERVRLTEQLAEDCWRHDLAFESATLIAHLDPVPPGLPSAHLARLRACLASPASFAEQAERLLLGGEAQPDEHLPIGALLLSRLVLELPDEPPHERARLRALLDLLDLTGPMATALEQGAAWWDGTMKPVAVARVDEAFRQEAGLAEVERTRAEAEAAFEAAALGGRNFWETWSRLFGPKGPMVELKEMIREGRHTDGQQWLESWGGLRRAADRLLDRGEDLRQEEMDYILARIQGEPRQTLKNHLERLIRAVRAWTQAARDVGEPVQLNVAIEDARALALALQPVHTALGRHEDWFVQSLLTSSASLIEVARTP